MGRTMEMSRGQPQQSARPRSFHAILRIEPPTTTHHDKIIAMRGRRGRRLMDSPRLVQARSDLAIALAASGAAPRKPLTGPIALLMEFVFGDAAEPAWMTAKPDDDNLQKTLQDVLTKAGWIDADQNVCFKVATKKRSTGAGRIEIIGRELHHQPTAITVTADQFEWTIEPEQPC